MRTILVAALAVLLMLALLVLPARASNGGADGFDFLLNDANARPVGLGGAYTALSADANAMRYNPAGLAAVDRHEVTFMHSESVAGIRQEYAAFASPLGWGLMIDSLSFGDVRRTTLADPGGLGDSAGLSDLAGAFGYGGKLTPELSLGLAAKFVREAIDDVVATGGAADFGALYAPKALPGASFGVSVLNVGPSINFQSERENLPLTARMGAAYAFDVAGHRASLAADLIKERSENAAPAAGLEILAVKSLAARVGYTGRNQAGLGITAGVGFLSDNFLFDYAFVPFGSLGNVHRFSATIRWGGGAPSKVAPSAPMFFGE